MMYYYGMGTNVDKGQKVIQLSLSILGTAENVPISEVSSFQG